MEGLEFRKKMKKPHSQFGIAPRRLPGSQLPTSSDIIGRLTMLRVELMENRSKDLHHLPMTECMRRVTDEVMELWERASIPTRPKH